MTKRKYDRFYFEKDDEIKHINWFLNLDDEEKELIRNFIFVLNVL